MEKRQNRIWRAMVGAALAAGIILALTGCGDADADAKTEGSGNAPALQKVRIGADSGAFSLPFRVAKQQGFFSKNGIDAEVTTFSFGIDTLNAVLTNRVDVGEAMDYAALTSLPKADLKVLSQFSSPTETSQKLFTRDGLSKPEDLLGKKLGVQKGTVNEYIWGKYFETFHIDKNDIKLVPLQSSAEILAAFDRGDIQAAWFSGAFIEKAEKVETSKALNDLSAIGVRTKGFVVVNHDLIKDNPQISAGLNKALQEANEYIIEHPEETAELAFKELKLPKDAVLKEIKNEWEFDVHFRKQDYEQLDQIKNWSVANGYIDQDYNLKDKLSLDGLKEAYPDKVDIQ